MFLEKETDRETPYRPQTDQLAASSLPAGKRLYIFPWTIQEINPAKNTANLWELSLLSPTILGWIREWRWPEMESLLFLLKSTGNVGH